MARKKVKEVKNKHTSIYAMSGRCLGAQCFRGYAPLSVLSQMSQADEYHQTKNPNGTQRNLQPKHAREAYKYALDNKNNPNALWPEIILNIRNNKALKIEVKSITKGPKDSALSFVKMQIKWDAIDDDKKRGKVAISRVDGNHRLFYAGGETNRNLPALDDVYSPFCIMDKIPTESERLIFRIINVEQKKLPTDHLLRIEQQRLSDVSLWNKDKSLWISKRLGEEKDSPFYGLVHLGGKKYRGEKYLINQKGLYDGIRQILNSFTRHVEVSDPKKIRDIIINYFKAVKQLWHKEWEDKTKYKLMTNTGMQALGIIGGKIMDNLFFIRPRSFKVENFKSNLNDIKQSIPNFWESSSEYMEGKSGRPGSQKIADDMYNIIKIQIVDDEIEV